MLVVVHLNKVWDSHWDEQVLLGFLRTLNDGPTSFLWAADTKQQKSSKKMENNEIKETKRGTRKPRAKRATAAEGDENAIFIGTLIQQELKNQERTVSWLARKLDCDRTNVYNIFRRQDIDTELLMRISVILHRDFFSIFSKEAKRKISATPGI